MSLGLTLVRMPTLTDLMVCLCLDVGNDAISATGRFYLYFKNYFSLILALREYS